jgi:hypothetical protein
MSIDHQIMWNRLIAVVEEQATTLIRTAFSTSVREAGDLSAGLFDRQARMIAQAVTGTPGHVNAMAESVGHFAREIGAQDILRGRCLCDERSLDGDGASARHHHGDAGVPARHPYRLLRLHGACGGYRRAGLRARCGGRCSRRGC